jgi:hypothetical protein
MAKSLFIFFPFKKDSNPETGRPFVPVAFRVLEVDLRIFFGEKLVFSLFSFCGRDINILCSKLGFR